VFEGSPWASLSCSDLTRPGCSWVVLALNTHTHTHTHTQPERVQAIHTLPVHTAERKIRYASLSLSVDASEVNTFLFLLLSCNAIISDEESNLTTIVTYIVAPNAQKQYFKADLEEINRRLALLTVRTNYSHFLSLIHTQPLSDQKYSKD